ncbi:hypothetical protein E1A91_A06G156600v1 [Gossypium mustelinum]|uniref:Uncharacterized protein n=1 Tax=Gossypium mustelinum TaxID=34275 RepID=A0A5D2YYJ3_GOSMU|nr:hypothetical protein E1A91_A06G156600v1 [Gossypium mustelinum]
MANLLVKQFPHLPRLCFLFFFLLKNSVTDSKLKIQNPINPFTTNNKFQPETEIPYY